MTPEVPGLPGLRSPEPLSLCCKSAWTTVQLLISTGFPPPTPDSQSVLGGGGFLLEREASLAPDGGDTVSMWAQPVSSP